jgi:hypothetical protein
LWFKIGLGLAREQGNTVELIRGHPGYGRLCTETDRVACARTHLNSGANLARKAGPPSLAAEAQHDLCAMLMTRGQLTEAATRARRALALYPKSHHRIPFFGADVALMLVLGRRYHAAARLLSVVLRNVQQPSARATILALTARAFAGAGEPEESAVLRRRTIKLLDKHAGMEPVIRWHLADAQRLAGNWGAAKVEGETALAVSVEQNDREMERLNRHLLKLIDLRKSSPGNHGGTSDELREFLRELADRVAKWSPRRGRQWPGPWGYEVGSLARAGPASVARSKRCATTPAGRRSRIGGRGAFSPRGPGDSTASQGDSPVEAYTGGCGRCARRVLPRACGADDSEHYHGDDGGTRMAVCIV